MRKYNYKGIRTYEMMGRWSADYVTEDGKRFGLHVACTKTKAEAYTIAKAEVDYLNAKEV